MNYRNVTKKSNKSKIAIIVISVIMVMALAVSGLAVFYHYYKDNASLRFKDLKNLDLERLEELEGVVFKKEELSYSGFTSELDGALEYSIINLHKDGFGKEFEEPNVGDVYVVQIEANGKTYYGSEMVIKDYHGKGTVEGVAVFDVKKDTAIDVYLLPYFYDQEVTPELEVLWKPDLIGTVITDNRPEGFVLGGYCLVIASVQPLEDIKFITFRKVD